MAQKHPQQFPWWEEARRPGFWGRIRAFRPGLLLALIAGAVLFAAGPAPPQNTSPGPDAPLGPAQNSSDAGAAQGGTEFTSSPGELPSVSLLAQLFGADAVDPLFSATTETGGAEDSSSEATPLAAEEPEEEPQRSIWRYLVAASDIGFEVNTSRLGLALASAEQGEADALNLLIAELEDKLLQFASLVAPEELAAQHTGSVAVLERYIQHLRASRDKADGSVEATWNNAERDAIAEEAGRINQEIRDIVHNTGTILPPGVLP